jgi:translocation and assembly module TamB
MRTTTDLHPDAANTRPRRALRRWYVIAPLALVGLVLVGLIALRIYLATPAAARLASEKLAASLGLPVQVKSVSPGFGSTGLRDVTVFEADNANGGKPWATAKEIEANTSIVGLALGKSPDHVTLRGADVTLRFDKDGALLTKMPQKTGAAKEGAKVPGVRLEGSRVTIVQEGHPDSTFAGLNADLADDNGKLTINGKIADAAWGKWSVAASLDTNSKAGSASLTTDEAVKVTPDLLRRVPFVSESVWDEVSLTSETTADVRFTFGEGGKDFRYVVTCAPRHTQVYVKEVDLTATDASGGVKVEASIVTLTGVRGNTADGTLDVDGVMNFRDSPNQLHLKVGAKGLQVKDLPKRWKIAEKVPVKGIDRGILGGNADLVLKTAKTRTTYAGTGAATVVIPHFVSGQDLTVKLQLHPREHGYEFGQAPEADDSTSLRPKAPESDVRRAVAALAMLLAQAPADAPKKDDAKKDPKAMEEPKAAPTYLDLSFSLKDVNIGELLQQLEVAVPFKINGRITFKVHASVPTATPGDLKTYRFTGTATMPRLTLEDMELEDVKAHVVYRDGILKLEDFSGRVPTPGGAKAAGGTFKGSATLGLVPAGDLVAKLDLDRLPIGQVLRLFPELAKGASGDFTGGVEFKAPAGKLRDPAGWTGSARLSAAQATALGWVVHKLDLDARLADGTLTVAKLDGVIEGATVDVSGDLRLADKYPFKGKARLGKVDLASLNKLVPALKPPVSLAGSFEAVADITGTLQPLALNAGGTASVAGLRVDQFPVEKLDFRWSVDPDRVKLTDLRSRLFGGEVTGEASVPLHAGAAGAIDLKLKGVDLAELSKQVPSAAGLKFEGKADGSVKATIPEAKPDQPRLTTAEVDVSAPKLKVRNIPAERLKANATYRQGVLNYKMEAAALGGTIELEGRYPPAPAAAEPPAEGKSQGRLSVRGVRLVKLWPALRMEKTLGPLDAEVSLNLPFDYNAEGHPVGVGTFRLDRVRYKDREITPSIRSAARLTGTELRLERIETALGIGEITGLVVINLVNVDRSRAVLHLRNVPSDKLLFALPDVARRIDAPLDVSVRTTLGREFRGGAVISTSRGKFYGLTIGSLRVPLDWELVPSQQRGSLTVRDLTGELAQGRLSGGATYEFYGDIGSRVEGHVKFTNIDLPGLLRSDSDLASLGVGQASGNFTFSGRDVRSANDLSGLLSARLGRTNLAQTPILRQIVPFLGPSGQVADEGSEVRARLANGVWNVERLALVGRTLQLYGSGTVTLAGRLNLAVTANTGRLNVSPLALRVFGINIPAMVGPVPVGLIYSASQYISNQTVNLEVTGTIDNPVVRIKAFQTLTEEAIRFFLNQKGVPLP